MFEVEAGADEKQQIKFVWPYSMHFQLEVYLVEKDTRKFIISYSLKVSKYYVSLKLKQHWKLIIFKLGN